jgi:hypothetical protein
MMVIADHINLTGENPLGDVIAVAARTAPALAAVLSEVVKRCR